MRRRRKIPEGAGGAAGGPESLLVFGPLRAHSLGELDFFFFFSERDAVVGSRRRRERGCGSGE